MAYDNSSIVQALLRGGAFALYDFAKRGDMRDQDTETQNKLAGQAEDLKKKKYLNTPIGKNDLDVPEGTPNEFAPSMVGMAAKKAGVAINQQKADTQQGLAAAHAQRWQDMTANDRAKLDLGLKGLGVRWYNAATSRMNANTNASKAEQGTTDKATGFLVDSVQKSLNLAREMFAQGDTTGAKSALEAAGRAAVILDKRTAAGGNKKPKPPANYYRIPTDALKKQFQKDNPNFDYTGG